MSNTQTCRLCLQEKRLINAHIIPEGFFRLLRSGNVAPEMHSNSPGSFPKRMPVGVYDSTILCGECDQQIAPWDDYGQQVLLQRFQKATPITHQARTVAWSLEEVNYTNLKLFFVALLWRASISSHNFYKRIAVGPFEKRLREMVLESEPGDSQEFAVILARFEDVSMTAMLDPHPERFDHIFFCRFYLSGFVSYIKVDKRPVPELLSELHLQVGKPLTILTRSLQGSPDGLLMRKIAESALAFRERRKGKIPG